ncbi:MAG: flagellar transcriptional regulator FlhD [Limnobacter sp.]|nr:flagellar transcriptional regulator FlhD [Limnobacter sp.]
MTSTHLIEEIRDANLSYLLLAQQLIREDRAEAVVRLGISEGTAELLDQLTTAQVLKIASNNVMMCSLRFEDEQVWKLLSNEKKDPQVSGLHAAILMAGKAAEQCV